MDTEKDPREEYTDWKAPEDEQSAAQNGFLEWSKVNAAPETELQNLDGLTALEKSARYDTVFREGSIKLMTELRDFNNNEIKLIDKLNIPEIKAELDALRDKDDFVALGRREEEVAALIQQAISEYPYEGSTCHTAEILSKKEMNCVGASVLGGALLHEAGIKYLVGNIGSHVLIIVKTSDNRILWQDMQDGKEINLLSNEELTEDKIDGKDEDGKNITPNDIAFFADNPQNKALTFFVKKEHWKDKPMNVLPPEFGLGLNVLINTGFMLGNRGKNEEAIEVLQVAMQKAPNNSDVHLGLARAYKNLGRYNEAIDACKKALEIDPKDSYLRSVMDELKVLGQ